MSGAVWHCLRAAWMALHSPGEEWDAADESAWAELCVAVKGRRQAYLLRHDEEVARDG